MHPSPPQPLNIIPRNLNHKLTPLSFLHLQSRAITRQNYLHLIDSPQPTRHTIDMAAPPATSETALNAMNDNAPPVSNGAPAEATQANSGLSADDFALYDRQIRLWGAQAQERIRNAHILLVSLRALGTEIAKNLTLAGISSLTIVDDEPVTEEDLGSCYFLRDEDVGKPVCNANFDMKPIK
jgi:hypothetical protein